MDMTLHLLELAQYHQYLFFLYKFNEQAGLNVDVKV